MIDKRIVEVFEKNNWFIATSSDTVNVVPVGFKTVSEDGYFAVGAVFLDNTLKNLEKNNQVAIAVLDNSSVEAYQVKGEAKVVKEGEIFDKLSEIAKETTNGQMTIKCAIIVKANKLLVASPNQDNNKEIEL